MCCLTVMHRISSTWNFMKRAATPAGWKAGRGELVVIEGEVADDQGRRKPPVALQAGHVPARRRAEADFRLAEELQHWPHFMESSAST